MKQLVRTTLTKGNKNLKFSNMNSNQSKKRPNRFGGDSDAVGARSSSANDSKNKFASSKLIAGKATKYNDRNHILILMMFVSF